MTLGQGQSLLRCDLAWTEVPGRPHVSARRTLPHTHPTRAPQYSPCLSPSPHAPAHLQLLVAPDQGRPGNPDWKKRCHPRPDPRWRRQRLRLPGLRLTVQIPPGSVVFVSSLPVTG